MKLSILKANIFKSDKLGMFCFRWSLAIYFFLFSTSVVFSDSRLEWSEIFSHQEQNQAVQLKVTYSPLEKNIFFYFFDEQKDFLLKEQFSVQSNESVQNSIEEIQALIASEKNIELSEGPLNDLIRRINRFKNLNPETCEVLHFSFTKEIKNREDFQGIENILSVLQEDYDESFFESIEISKFEMNNQEYFIHLTLDKNSTPQRVSLTKEGESFEDAKIQFDEGRYFVRNHEGQIELILQLPLNEFDPENSYNQLVIYYPSDKERGLKIKHLTLRRQSHDRTWEAVSTQGLSRQDFDEIQDLELTYSKFKHRPSIHISGTDVYLPFLSENETKNRLGKFYGESSYTESDSQKYRDLMLDCMLNQAVLDNSSELRKIRDHIHHYCLARSDVEFLLSEKKYLNDNEVFKLNLDLSQKLWNEKIKKCLSSEGDFLKKVDGSYYYDFFEVETLSRGLTKKCQAYSNEKTLEAFLSEEIFPDDFFIEHLESYIVEHLLDDCLEFPERCMETVEKFQKYTSLLYNLPGVEYLANDIDLECFHNSRKSEDCLIGVFQNFFDHRSELILKGFVSNSQYLTEGERYEGWGRSLAQMNSKEFDQANETFQECFNNFSEKKSFRTFVESFEDGLHQCAVQGARDVASSFLISNLDHALKEISLSSKEGADFIESQKEYLKQQIEKAESLSELDQAYADHFLLSVSSFLSDDIYTFISSAFDSPDGEQQERFYREAAREVQSSLSHKMGGPAHFPLNFIIMDYLKSAYDDEGKKGVEKKVKNLLLDISKEISVLKIQGKSLDTEDLFFDDLTEQVKLCYSEKRDEAQGLLTSIVNECKELMTSELVLYKRSKKNNQKTAQYFPIDSEQGTQLSSINDYFKKCLEFYNDYSPFNNIGFENWVKGCKNGAQIDQELQLVQLLSKSYFPFLGEERTQRTFDNFLDCKRESLDKDNPSFLSQVESQQDFYSRPSELLASIFSTSDFQSRDEVDEVEKKLGELLQVTELSSQTCLEHYRGNILDSMKDFIVQVFPEDIIYTDNREGEQETYREVISRVLDPELVQLFIDVSQVHSDREGAILYKEDQSLTQKTVTPILAKNSLRELVESITEAFTQGLIFDTEAVEREIIIFNQELKNAFEWLKSQDREVALHELEEFFIESKLADYLALAEVSKSTRTRLFDYVRSMAKNEKDELRKEARGRSFASMNSSQRERFLEIQEKHLNLYRLINEMTKSYDFRRIMRTSQKESQELLELIKKEKVLPEIFGHSQVTSKRQYDIDSKVADFVAGDTSIGGFGERFVREIAIDYLEEQRQSKWAVTRWLFYDEEDFDWTHLRTTPSGRRAIEYYTRYILYPNMLGIEVSATQKRLRETYFYELIDHAQKE